MATIDAAVLLFLLNALSCHELQEIYGLTRLQLPWQLVELVIHAYLIRRICVPEFDFPPDLGCIEFFSGGWGSSQVAKAFEELGCRALAFDILRALIFGLPRGPMPQKQ